MHRPYGGVMLLSSASQPWVDGMTILGEEVGKFEDRVRDKNALVVFTDAADPYIGHYSV